MVRPASATYPASAGLALGLLMTSCTSWRVQSAEPSALILREHPSQVRLSQRDGSRLVLNNPNVFDQNLIGMSRGKRVTIPAADVSSIAVRSTSWVKTTTLILAPLGLVCLLACRYN